MFGSSHHLHEFVCDHRFEQFIADIVELIEDVENIIHILALICEHVVVYQESDFSIIIESYLSRCGATFGFFVFVLYPGTVRVRGICMHTHETECVDIDEIAPFGQITWIGG